MCSKIWSLFHWRWMFIQSKLQLFTFTFWRLKSLFWANERVWGTRVKCHGLRWGRRRISCMLSASCSLCMKNVRQLTSQGWHTISHSPLGLKGTLLFEFSCDNMLLLGVNSATLHCQDVCSSHFNLSLLIQPLECFLWILLVLHEPLWCLRLTLY